MASRTAAACVVREEQFDALTNYTTALSLGLKVNVNVVFHRYLFLEVGGRDTLRRVYYVNLPCVF